MASSLRYGDAKVSPGFIARKSKILSDLAVPDGEYTDLSPKGSVDEGIRDLIKEINALDGLVTTSSCAGRVSVFVEGHKSTKENRKTANAIAEDEEHVAFAVEQDAEHIDNRDLDDEEGEEGDVEGERRKRFVPSGGKGSGRWLYVSHDPIDIIDIINGHETPSLHELFGLIPGDGIPKVISGDAHVQLIRFHYDPMVRSVIPDRAPLSSKHSRIKSSQLADPTYHDRYAISRQTNSFSCFLCRLPRKRATELAVFGLRTKE